MDLSAPQARDVTSALLMTPAVAAVAAALPGICRRGQGGKGGGAILHGSWTVRHCASMHGRVLSQHVPTPGPSQTLSPARYRCATGHPLSQV